MFQQNVNGNKTSSAPFVSADGWVWFQGPNNALIRMRPDGSEFSAPGSHTTLNTPFVTADGWVWFQGAGDKLFRMKPDGSQQTQVDGNRTASSPAVGPITVAQGVVGEWVWFRGIGEGALWRDFVPATALGPPETVEPAYYVVTVAYAPPGAKGGTGSLVQYDTSSSTGTTTSTSHSFKADTEAGASIGKDFIDASITAAWSETDTSSLTISKGQAYTIKITGPGDDGINHDYDLFLLLLNPIVTVQQYPQNFVLWSMGTKGMAEIHEVYAGELKGTLE